MLIIADPKGPPGGPEAHGVPPFVPQGVESEQDVAGTPSHQQQLAQPDKDDSKLFAVKQYPY